MSTAKLEIKCTCCGRVDNKVLIRPEKTKTKLMPIVDIKTGSLTISDLHGEIVHWAADEWLRDPSIVVSIISAVRIAYTKGTDRLRKIMGSPVCNESA